MYWRFYYIFDSGFVYTFNRNLLGDYSNCSLISFADTSAYSLGALLFGFFISYARRMILMVVYILVFTLKLSTLPLLNSNQYLGNTCLVV